MKNIRIFLSENFPFLVVKCSIYLNRRVFVMSGHFPPDNKPILRFLPQIREQGHLN